MSAQDSFSDLNIDAVTGTSLMNLLGLSTYDLSNPQRFSKFRSVIDFFKQFPEDTRKFLITRATLGKNVDKLDHVFEYSQLLDSKINLEKQIEDFKNEVSVLNISDPLVMIENEHKSSELDLSLKQLQSRIEVYEK